MVEAQKTLESTREKPLISLKIETLKKHFERWAREFAEDAKIMGRYLDKQMPKYIDRIVVFNPRLTDIMHSMLPKEGSTYILNTDRIPGLKTGGGV